LRRPPDWLAWAWYGRVWYAPLLWPPEILYRVVMAMRRWLYMKGVLPRYRAPVPVVVVGNIALGGTGKTPLVIALVKLLAERGIRAGVVSRGYGAQRRHKVHVLGPISAVEDCGDEALMVYRRCGCPCAVSPDRPAAARALLTTGQVDILLSDDGLQHYALERDLEIALTDSHVGHGNRHCLPAGPLREPLSRLRSVDRVLERGGTDPGCALVLQPAALVHLASGREEALDPDRVGPRVYALAGVANPQLFLDTLRTKGFDLELRLFPDHHPYVAADLAGLADKPVIMTEKDAVKCVAFAGDGTLDDAWYLKVEAIPPADLVERIAALVRQ